VLVAAAGLASLATKKKKDYIVMPSKEMMHLILDKIVREIDVAKASDGASKRKESEIIEKHKKTICHGLIKIRLITSDAKVLKEMTLISLCHQWV